MTRQRIRNIIGTVVAFAILVGFTALVIISENLLDATKAHKAGGG